MSLLRSVQVQSVVIAAAVLLAGCSADKPLNPSFPLTVAQAREALRQMRADPKPLQRPVLVLSGIHDPGIVVSSVAQRLRRITTDGTMIQTVSFFGADTFDACRKRVLDRAEALAADRGESDGSVEIDVVAVSMGGLVARHAAMPQAEDDRKLHIRRLFTISSPHRGASMAGLPTFDQRIIDMRPSSAFLADLDAALEETDYELIPYVRLGDAIVGETNAAPPGRQAWWVAAGVSLAHVSAYDDLRIIADIARRLRGEEPFTRDPPAEIPESPATGGGS